MQSVFRVGVASAFVVAAPLFGFVSDAQAATFSLEEATVESINKAFNSGALTSEGLIQLYLNRINEYDDELNSIITLNPAALETARALDLERQTTGPRSPLHGIPVILKDNFDTFDLPTTGGSAVLAGSIPPDDAFTVQKLRDAGAIILAKANLSEFAAGVPGGSLIGLTSNPYNPIRSPGGSSGGTGAAIAANFAVIGTGSDTGGSIRGPAAANGLVGIKPTLGLLSRDGIIPLSLSFDTGGPLTRTVTDAAIALSYMAGVDPADPATLASEGKVYDDYTQFLDKGALAGARIGVLRDFFGRDNEVDQLIENALETMEGLGATIVDSLSFPEAFIRDKGTIYTRVRWPDFKEQIPDYLATVGDQYPKSLEEIVALAEANPFYEQYPARLTLFRNELASGSTTDPDYIDAQINGRGFITSTVLDLFSSNDLDAVIYPTSGCASGPLPGLSDPTYVCGPGESATNIANLTGFPDVQVPSGFTSDGMPVTLSFLGKAWSEPELLGFAYAYEQATKLRKPSPLVPALAGETIEYESVPEPGAVSALVGMGTVLIGTQFLKRRRLSEAVA